MHQESWRRTLARLSLFALIAIIVIAAVIFIAIYGVMRNPDADYTALAVGALVTGASTLIGAAALASKIGNGHSEPPAPPPAPPDEPPTVPDPIPERP